MNAKLFSIVAGSGVLIGSMALAQAPPTGAARGRVQGGELGASGASPIAPGRATDDGDKTTGFGGRDDGFAREEHPTGEEGRLRGDRDAGMMDNVRRDDAEWTDR